MSDDYELQKISTWRLRELLQHEKDNQALRAHNAELLAALKAVEDRLHLWMVNNTGAAELDALEMIEAAIAKADGGR